MNHFTRTFASLCFGWTALYLLWGGTSSGKSWFSRAAESFFPNDYKGGLPIVVLAWPILVSTLVATLLWKRHVPEQGPERLCTVVSHACLPQWMIRLCQGGRSSRGGHCCTFHVVKGDAMAPRFVSLLLLSLLTAFTIGSLIRKLGNASSEWWDWKVMEVSNIFGFTALVALGLLLIPVTKFSPLMQVFGLSAPTSLSLHQTAGRFVVLASLFHGGGHVYRWTGIAGEGLGTMIFPPRPCWNAIGKDDDDDVDFEPTCRSEDTDCTCYDLFKNLAGIIAGVGLILIGVSSLAPVRRSMYWLFYRIHILAGPLVFVAVVVHWNRSILYLIGGMLYYWTMYVMTVAEDWLPRSLSRSEGVALLAAERITASPHDGAATASSSSSFVSLTFQADAVTVARYQPTQYVKLKIPAISSLAHPFSINRVPQEPQKLRLVIRENGAFTKQLAQYCGKNSGTGSCAPPASLSFPTPPAIFLDGFYGTDTRLSDVLQHDVVVMIAGGIGITTYLTLLKDTLQIAQAQPDRRVRKILLHWICREGHLIDYIRREYFDDLSNFVESIDSIHLGITVNNTGPRRECAGHLDEENAEFDTNDDNEDKVEPSASLGNPFRHSRYMIGTGSSCLENSPVFFAFLLMTVIGLSGTWYCYAALQSSEDLFSRFWVILFLSLIGATLGIVLNLVFVSCCKRLEMTEAQFTPIRSDDGVEMETILSTNNASISAGGIQREELRTFSFKEEFGRPSIHTILNPLEESKYPAVFSCGPDRLMSEVRDKTLGRCRIRLQRWVCGEPSISLYEEAFEM